MATAKHAAVEGSRPAITAMEMEGLAISAMMRKKSAGSAVAPEKSAVSVATVPAVNPVHENILIGAVLAIAVVLFTKQKG